jgi:uncharacterized protein YutE (UPF0331/DUF86 family)
LTTPTDYRNIGNLKNNLGSEKEEREEVDEMKGLKNRLFRRGMPSIFNLGH